MNIGLRKLGVFLLVWAGFAAAAVLLVLFRRPLGLEGTAALPVLVFAAVLAAAAVTHLVMYRRHPRRIPVFMYHSVSDEFEAYPHPEINMSVALLDWQLSHLRRRRVRTLCFHELHEYLDGRMELDGPAVVLTFDDGQLDNWTHVFPMLKKHQAKAVFFVPTDFIEEGDGLRPSLDDVSEGEEGEPAPPCDGYMNWREIEAVSESGLVEVLPHGRSHDWAFTCPEIVDFRYPGDGYYWLDWLDRPQDKSLGFSKLAERGGEPGRPVYRHDRSLLQPRYLEDPGLREACVARVRSGGGRAFFDNPEWRSLLVEASRKYLSSAGVRGRMETSEEYRQRVIDELTMSRRIVERHTGKPAEFFCWPGEVFSEEGLRLALTEAGFKRITGGGVENHRGGDPHLVGRKVTQEIFRLVGFPALDRLMFAVNLKVLEGNYYYYLLEFPLNRVKDWIRGRRCRGQAVHVIGSSAKTLLNVETETGNAGE